MKTENEICECGHPKYYHKRKMCIDDETAMECSCKKFIPQKQDKEVKK